MTLEITSTDIHALDQAVTFFSRAHKTVALTGAGISVASGIDDFRSPGGLWERFPPDTYATLQAFQTNPSKTWDLFHILSSSLRDKEPNGAHMVLAHLENQGLLQGIITQNIDGLHQRAGSKNVLELHGDVRSLHCIQCGYTKGLSSKETDAIPSCPQCKTPLKPNVVLFGEEVHFLQEATKLLHNCDLLLVVGTSAQVFPAAEMPEYVKMAGGKVFEFNKEPTVLSGVRKKGLSDILFRGQATQMLKLFVTALGCTTSSI